ncbi:MAG: hypothetical protein ABL904_17160 [Hyphomicrobiaceae bacterium]
MYTLILAAKKQPTSNRSAKMYVFSDDAEEFQDYALMISSRVFDMYSSDLDDETRDQFSMSCDDAAINSYEENMTDDEWFEATRERLSRDFEVVRINEFRR